MSSQTHDTQLGKISKFIAGIVEGRDPELGGHLQRLGKGTAAFARRAGCSPAETEILVIGAHLHDIGKLSISESILNKPARLTAAEFSLVQQHTVFGSKLLAPLEMDVRIPEIVLYHHENYDGSGYPHGLAGEAIPFLARMVRIWDSCDALTMDRPYHKGVSVEDALQIMRRDVRFYDPDLFKLFCDMMLDRSV